MPSLQTMERVSDRKGISYAFAGFTFWVLTDTFIKLVGQSGLPPYEMVAFLGLFMSGFLALYTWARGQQHLLRPHRLSRQIARACLDMANNVCVVIALRHLTLTLFYILIFLAPIVVSLLSAIFLREGLSPKKTAALIAGFAGVIIAVHPWSSAREGDWVGFAACMVCVTCFSINMVWSRVLTKTESPESLAVFSGIVTATAGFTLTAFVHAAPLSLRLTAESLAMGIFCALGTLCFFNAVKHTSAANVSQYHYTQLVTGTLLTWLIWGTRPGVYVLLGGGLILTSGLYIAITAHNTAAFPVLD
jgi:drug/metabolite transporter (DMT)-like permease